MRPDGIVMTAPALDDDLRLAESVEDLAVEQLVPEPGIKALDIAILPRAGCRRFRAARARPRSRPAGHRRRDNPALSRALGPACAACQTDAQSEVTPFSFPQRDTRHRFTARSRPEEGRFHSLRCPQRLWLGISDLRRRPSENDGRRVS